MLVGYTANFSEMCTGQVKMSKFKELWGVWENGTDIWTTFPVKTLPVITHVYFYELYEIKVLFQFHSQHRSIYITYTIIREDVNMTSLLGKPRPKGLWKTKLPFPIRFIFFRLSWKDSSETQKSFLNYVYLSGVSACLFSTFQKGIFKDYFKEWKILFFFFLIWLLKSASRHIKQHMSSCRCHPGSQKTSVSIFF